MTATLPEQAEIEIRSGDDVQIADVNVAKRIVTVRAMPYEQPTELVYRGRLITEIVSRAAFAGVETRARTVKVNRDHDMRQTVGKVIALHPSRPDGLVAELKIARVPLGDDTLVLCDEGILGASVGFGLLRQNNGAGPIWDDAETWENNRSVRRLNRLHLDHLALVANPQYDDAVVLDVRNARKALSEPLRGDDTPAVAPSTPNLDRLAEDALRARFDEINRRWQ